ncbi:Negative elongation factor D [Fasciola hepatica]|uniref:Negative elongation factor D n=1 Tax=Fasciola hepatica TaxID=6192 RepID=A0A4E0QVW7_FASHE|nr:Negative elongation factor D [Fasciola hepatica]
MSECYKAILRKKDAILELPSVLADAIDHVREDEPDGAQEAERILVENYQGAIEFLFELGTWLTYIDEDPQSTRNIIESVIKEAILQNYDRSKAITCLTDDALADTMDWLSRMVESPTWRQTIYELAQHPRNEDCPFLSLAMPCIAVKDSLIGELISVPLAWNTLEIFLKCVAYVLNPLLAAGETVKDGLLTHSVAFLQPRKSSSSESGVRTIENATLLSEISEFVSCSSTVKDAQKIGSSLTEQTTESPNGPSGMLPRFLEMGCHSEHGYLILQSILQCLASRIHGHSARHLSWLLEAEASRRNRDVSRYSVYFCGARDHPDSMDAMRAILRDQELLPNSVNLLYEEYKKDFSPPVQLLRQPIFISKLLTLMPTCLSALLADALFATSDRLLAEQQEQFAYLYSYAAMVVESLELVTDRLLASDRSRVEEAKREVLEASRICRQN